MADSVQVSTNLIAAVAMWASTDAAHKCGVVFFGGDRIIATDGHRLVVVPHATHGHTFGVVRAHLLAAVAAQDVLSRDGIDPPVNHDLVLLRDGDMGLADGPRGDRVIKLVPDDNMIAIDIGAPVITVPRIDVSSYPIAGVDDVFKGAKPKGDPDGYVLDIRYLSAITAINNATAGFTDVVRVTGWSRIDKRGARTALVLEGATGARFAIMPHLDKHGEPS